MAIVSFLKWLIIGGVETSLIIYIVILLVTCSASHMEYVIIGFAGTLAFSCALGLSLVELNFWIDRERENNHE
jgi:uncharacterized membrane protein YuzA (DUF378 family)